MTAGETAAEIRAVGRAFTASRGGQMRTGMNLGRLLLRATVGSIFIEHGTQKLFGWFGGHGLAGSGQFFESLGLRPGRRNALAAGTAETGGGLLLVLGAATPLAAAAVSSVMVTALRTAIWRDGIKAGTGGYEMLLLVSALALAEGGPGPLSIDELLGTERRGAAWAAAALGAAAIGSSLAVAVGKRTPPVGPPTPAEGTDAGAAAATPA